MKRKRDRVLHALSRPRSALSAQQEGVPDRVCQCYKGAAPRPVPTALLLLVRHPRLLNNFLDLPLILAPVLLVEARGLRVGGRARVGVAQQRLDRGEDGGDVVDGRPLVLQDVEADRAVGVDVRVELPSRARTRKR